MGLPQTSTLEPDLLSDVHKARAGDTAAFERLYIRHVGRVHGLCRRLTGEAQAAEDAVQETFMQAWRKREQFRDDGPFEAWLCAIAARTALMARRRWTRYLNVFSTQDPETVPRPAQRNGVPARLDLEQAMDALPERARQVFVLHDVEGYLHGEIAGLLGVTTGTSKSQLHRARKLLRESLSQ